MNSSSKAPVNDLIRTVRIERVTGVGREALSDVVAVEEPVGIFVQYYYKQKQRTESLAVAMRTPGHDSELACGFLYSEGVIQSRADVVDIRSLGSEGSNEILVELAAGVDVDAWRLQRSSLMQSSCGICGKQNLDALADVARVSGSEFAVEPGLIHQLPDILRGAQSGFAQTGGLHAAASMDRDGYIAEVFEDIGRHNALDKLIGASFLSQALPLSQSVLFMSSRGSFELVQKAAAAGAPVLATVGSPSTLAIEAARRAGLTLIGFVRSERFNIYSGFERIRS